MAHSCWVVIVNYRTPDLVLNSLCSISCQLSDLGRGGVLVVDNDSHDGSVEQIASAIELNGWTSWAKVHSSGRNGGFAFGNNIGLKYVFDTFDINQPDYIIFLNPDTVVGAGAIHALLAFLEIYPNVGVAGSRLLNEDGGVEPSAHNFPSSFGELDNGARLGFLSYFLASHVNTPPIQNVAHGCDWVSGASMVIRRKVFEDIGLLDEGYFLYFEEVDFCRRAKSAGWECWYVPESRVMHMEGASTGIRTTAKRRPAYWYFSRRRYFVKHHGIVGFVFADLLWAVGRFSFLLRRALKLGAQGENLDPKWFTLDLLWGDFRALFSRQLWQIPREGRRA